MYKNVLFDLDGTIIDSMADIIASLKIAYEKEGLKEAKPEQKHIGPPLLECLKSITPELEKSVLEKVAERFRKNYDFSDYPHTRLYPGIKELLAGLINKGISIYLVTNKRLPPTIRLVEKFGLKFKDVLSPDSLAGKKMSKTEMLRFLLKKENIEVATAIYVGDGVSDVKCSGENGLPVIAVTYGYGMEAELKASGPKYMAKDVEELKRILL